MIRFRRGNWHWRFVSEAAAREAGDPLDTAGAEVVQQVRESRVERSVFRRGGFYFKRETLLGSSLADRLSMRFFPRTAAEFDSIMLLKRAGIPVVEPVGCGSDGNSAVLITRAVEGTVTVREQLRRFEAAGEALPDEFLRGWSEVAAALFRRWIYFPDFHRSNILYCAAEGTFTVVDPLGAKYSILTKLNWRMKMIRRQYGDSFGQLPKSTVLRMLAVMLPRRNPEKVYRRLLRHTAAYIRRHSLRKRRRLEHFRRGEYTRIVDGVECRLDAAGEPLTREGAEALSLAPERAAQLWERDWLFTLFHLPTLRIVGRDVESGTLYRECAGAVEVAEAERRDLLERVELAGFDPREFVCRRDCRGRAVLEDLGPK